MTEPELKPAFDAGEVVEPLSWDFTKFVPDAKGITPEPTPDMVFKFRQTLGQLIGPTVMEQADRDPDWTPTAADLAKALSDENMDEQKKLLDRVITATAKVCGNSPSAFQIRKLPWRIQRNFLGYAVGCFTEKA